MTAVVLMSVAPSDAAKRVTCDGERATVVGSEGTDVFATDDLNSGDVVATLGGGDSVIINDMNNVVVCLGEGSDNVFFGSNAGPGMVVNGGPGGDSVRRSQVEEAMTLRGQNGSDVIYGGEGDDRIAAGTGVDFVVAGAGNDRVRGGGGGDSVEGKRGRDRMLGGPGGDDLFGAGDKLPPLDVTGDFADGGGGRDYCQAGHRRRCERESPQIPY